MSYRQHGIVHSKNEWRKWLWTPGDPGNVIFSVLIFVWVLRGLKPVPDEEVVGLYGGTHHVPLNQDSGFYGKVGWG
jgi:hypothetical protein